MRGRCAKNWGKIAIFTCATCAGATLSHEMRVDRQKTEVKIAILLVLLVPEQPFRTKWGLIVKNWGKIAILLVPDLSWSNPFARNEGRSSKTEVKLRFYLCRNLSWRNPFARNEGRSSKNCGKNCDFTCAGLVLEEPFRTKGGSIRKNWGKIAIFTCAGLVPGANPFARNEGRCANTEVKLRFFTCAGANPFARNEARCAKTEVKIAM